MIKMLVKHQILYPSESVGGRKGEFLYSVSSTRCGILLSYKFLRKFWDINLHIVFCDLRFS